MIEVVKKEGVPISDLEKCCFCRVSTSFWFKPKDVAVCERCARVAAEKDVPTKKQWCRSEAIATYYLKRFPRL